MREFLDMPVWLTDELHELLVEARNETIDALKGRRPLDQLQGVPQKKVS
jgi:hypothetical protein